jgi:hypothetical protein
MKYTLIILLFSFGCNSSSEKITHLKSVSSKEKNLQNTTIKEVNQNLNFDALKFVSLSDSLLTKIKGQPIVLKFKIDTIKSDKTDKTSFYNSLFSTDKCLVKRYSFDPGKGNRELRFWLVEASYQDSISISQAFEELHNQSGKVDIKNDFHPGLTYTNDYVIKSSNKIYWLNSGCIYSFKNHLKLKQNMLRSVDLIKIQDSILCRCGQTECSF